MQQQTQNNAAVTRLCDQYIFKSLLGKGAFGEVYEVYDKIQKKSYACKVGTMEDRKYIKYEYKIYKLLEQNIISLHYNPRVYRYIEVTNSCMFVMDMLGANIEKLYDMHYKGGPVKITDLQTLLKLAIASLKIIKELHIAGGFIHRDIKPSNFVIDAENKGELYIIDFGLAKKYSPRPHFKANCEFTGTLRFASINVTLGIEPTRRDDLESLGYMFIFLARNGNLPWMGLKGGNLDKVSKIKLTTDTQKLCEGLPECFHVFLDYCKKLNFTETPNYDMLINLFLAETIKQKFSSLKYFWEVKSC